MARGPWFGGATGNAIPGYRNTCSSTAMLTSVTDVRPTQITLSWQAINGAQGYRVYLRPQTATTWTTTQNLPASARTHTFTGLQPGTTYSLLALPICNLSAQPANPAPRHTQATPTVAEYACAHRRDDLGRSLPAACLYHLIDTHLGWDAWAATLSPAQLQEAHALYPGLLPTRTTPGAHMRQTELHTYGSARLGMDRPDRNLAPATLLEIENPYRPGTWLTLSPPQAEGDGGGSSGGQLTHTFMLGLKRYEITNHLGNVLATISDRKHAIATDGTFLHWQAEVISTSDYYPFGSTMPGREYSSSGYRYGFNGKENDAETSWQDYGFRMYSPKLSRFFTVDPLTRDYPWYTPYQFAGNKPIMCSDLDGKEESAEIWQNQRDRAILNPKNDPEIDRKFTEAQTKVLIYGGAAIGGFFTGGSTWYGVAASEGLWSMGANLLDQTMHNEGSIDWGEVALSGAVGAAFGGGSSLALKGLGKMASTFTSNIDAKWVSESTSGLSSSAKNYQEYVTGVPAGNALEVGGVKFDGIRGNTLLEAKSSYDNFVNSSGDFYGWFKGKDALVKQARSQTDAAGGAPIEWNFSSQKTQNATQKLFDESGIKGINLKHNPQK